MHVDRLSVTRTDTSVTLHLHGRPIVRYARTSDYAKLIRCLPRFAGEIDRPSQEILASTFPF